MRGILGQISTSVVTRMRAGMLAIGILVTGLLVAGNAGLSRIDAADRTLLDEAVPNLLHSEHLHTNIADLSALLDAVPELRTAQDLTGTGSRIDAIFSLLHDNLDADSRLVLVLNDLETVAASMQSHAANRMFHIEERVAIQHRAWQVIGRIRALLPKMATQGADTVLSDPGGQAAVTPDGPGPAPQVRQNPWLSALEEEISEVPHLLTVDRVRAIEAEFEQYLLALSSGMRALPDTGLRAEADDTVLRLRTLLLGTDGLIRRQMRIVETTETLLHQGRRQDHLLRLVTEESSAFVGMARAEIHSAIGNVSQQIASMSLMLRVVSIAVLILLATIAIWLVERQIVHRLVRLTRAVRRIADGDHQHHVGVGGRDELAAMAASLEVFKDNSRELQRSNADLARFAYAASHDLRAPLGTIRDLTAWSLDDGGAAMPAGCRKNLEMVLQRVDRLSRLLANLQDYSRVGSEQADLAETALDALIRDLMQKAAPDGRFRALLLAPEPVIVTYAVPLAQVLRFLIENAVQHHDRDEGVVTIEMTPAVDRMRFSVTDDGPGIPPEFHERIFNLFQTLDAGDQGTGGGMGLAVCRKLVERYGGRLAVRSAPGEERGTCFEFDWPFHRALAAVHRAA